jgi:LysM repeat protein/ethanolamine utilization microcompartment shell protein EutS
MPHAGRRLIATAVGLLLSVLTVSAVAADGLHHTVRAGDTLSGIANEYGITIEILTGINGIADPNLIIVGDVLNLPGGSPATPAPGGALYVIQPGDTLSHIAVRFDITVAELKSANGLDSDLIIAGHELVIPGHSSLEPAPVSVPPAPPAFEMPTAPIDVPLQRPHSPEIEAMVNELAPDAGVDPGIAKSIAWVESGFDQGVQSHAGAIGVMQLMPGTIEWIEDDILQQELNEDVSAYDNIKAGVYLLGYLQRQTGSAELAVAAYYQGLGATQQGIMYNETRRYVDGVMAIKATFWP